jgi:ABC-type transporter Mla subunit MlaD
MAMWQVALGILALLACVWTFAVVIIGIPMLLRLAQTLRRVDNLIRDAELNLGPALIEFRDMMRNLNKASAGVADGVAQAGHAFEAVGELGKTLHGTNRVLRAALGPSVTVTAGFLAGMRAGGRVLLRQFFARR